MSRRKWACDASPLILLAKAGYVDLLPALAGELLIPEAAAREIKAGPEDDPARHWLKRKGRGRIHPPGAIVPLIASWDLGPGESETLSLVYERPGWTALLDDRAARRCAEALNIPVLGCIGVVLTAKVEGLITQATPVLESLVRAGLRVDDTILTRALRLAGED